MAPISANPCFFRASFAQEAVIELRASVTMSSADKSTASRAAISLTGVYQGVRRPEMAVEFRRRLYDPLSDDKRTRISNRLVDAPRPE